MKLPRRQPRSVYAVYESDELADGAVDSDALDDFPSAFDRELGAVGQSGISIDSDRRPADKLPRASTGISTGTSTGRVIGGVLAGIGAACALAVLTIALLGLADGGTSTPTHPDNHQLSSSAARVPAPRALRAAPPRHSAGVRGATADLRGRVSAGVVRRRKHGRAASAITASRLSSASAAPGTASAPQPVCSCLLAEIEFGFER